MGRLRSGDGGVGAGGVVCQEQHVSKGLMCVCGGGGGEERGGERVCVCQEQHVSKGLMCVCVCVEGAGAGGGGVVFQGKHVSKSLM